jgi:opacity protein-like surface antigen
MKALVMIGLSAIATLWPTPGLAQLRSGTWELNGFAGYFFAGSVGQASTTAFPTYDIEVDDNANYGGRLGYNITSALELEVEYSQTNTTFGIPTLDPNDPQNNLPGGDLKVQYFMGYATFNFGHGRLVPFFTIGGGVADLSVHAGETLSSNSTSRFTGGIGAGVKYFVTPHFALRADGRLLSTDLGSATVFCGYGYTCTQSGWMNNGTATGGVLFAF